jgi:CHAT domain-containing protein/Tfp pilus assembly protein PilF
VVLLLAAWGLAGVGSAEEPAKPPRLTAEQQKQLQQSKEHREQARKLWGKGKRADAIQEWQTKLALERAVWGKDHPNLVPSLQALARSQEAVEDFARARQALQEVLAIRTKRLGEKHWQVGDARRALADLDLRAKLKPADRSLLRQAWSLNQQVFQLYQAGRPREALPLAQRAVEIRGKILGEGDPDYALSLFNLAAQYKALAEYAKAEPLYRRSLQIRETRLGQDHPYVAESLNNLASLYQAQGQYARAEPLLRRSLQIREASFGKDHPNVAHSLNNLANLCWSQGQSAKAEPLYRRSLAICEARLGPDHPEVATCLNNLGALYRAQGQYARAEPLVKRSLQIREARLGKDHPLVAESLNNLASLHQAQGQYARAEPLFRRSLDIYEARLGQDHPDVAHSLNNLAVLYRAQGRYAEAEPLLRRSLQIREARLGQGHPAVAQSLNSLATLHQEQGQYARAEPLFRRGLKIWEARLGQDHPDVATSLNNLAVLYRAQGQYARAEPLFRRSLDIYEARLGKDHPNVALSLNNLATLCASQEHWDQAVQTYAKARRRLRQQLHRVLPALTPHQQLTFLRAKVEANLYAALTLALRRRGEPGPAEQSAAWLLNSKALTQQALTEPLLLARAGAHPRLTALHDQLLEVRQRLARLTLAAPQPGQEPQRRRQLDDLAEQERQLTKKLGQKSGERLADPGWIELATVRQALPPDAVLIDIARFSVFDFRAKGKEPRWQAARYAAWVIPPQGKGGVRLLDLGEAAPIEAAVKEVRQLLAAAPNTLADQEAAAEQRLRRALDDLAGRLLRPLAEHVGKTRHWIVSPDAALWLVPWAALPLADGAYAIEKHRISYVVSGRDLVRAPDPAPGKGALVLADPDFDLTPARGTKEANTALASRGLLPGAQLPRFQRLPGTAREARAIAPLLERYTGQPPAVRTGQEAREEAFKALRHPKVVVLSTHGYFLEDQDQALVPALAGLESRGLKMTALDRPRPKGEKVQVLENPLLRCGLALAGANRRNQAPEGAEDGILTGLEIVGCDLRGTELVVLSACETGLGKVNIGEGVAGLRQAFQLAGARTVMATLWQIPDRETTALMTAFFTHLAGKKGKAEALRQAQRDLIQQRRARGKAAHPFYWAAFTLTGQWQ